MKKIIITAMFILTTFASAATVSQAQRQTAPAAAVSRVEVEYDGAQAKTFKIVGANLCGANIAGATINDQALAIISCADNLIVAITPQSVTLAAPGTFILKIIYTDALSRPVVGAAIDVTIGAQGAKGDKGDTGDTGATGAQGTMGATGAQGPQGAKGDKGDQGDLGETGATGAQGIQGAKGDKGDIGATGAQGEKGDRGLNWRDAWQNSIAYLANDAVSYNGSSWFAKQNNSNSAPAENADWTLLAQRGEQGGAGAQGATGAAGPAGPQGPQGAPGNMTAGSPHYIQNQTAAAQTSTNFNISGTGAANIFNAQTQFNIGGNRVVSAPGTDNFFAGINAGINNHSNGKFNTFVGANAGKNNYTGIYNSFFGAEAGTDNTQGESNSFFGTDTGAVNKLGDNNSYFGRSAGRYNVNGSDNSFVGAFAGESNTGSSNSFLGKSAGASNTTGNENVFIGVNNGNQNTTGKNNSFFGTATGQGNITGGKNTLVGHNSNVAAGNLNFASAFGANAVVSADDTIVIGKTAGTYNGVSRPADAVVIPGNLTVNGTLNAAIDGTNLTNLNANNLTTGTVTDARLSSNVATLTGAQTFTGAKTFSGGISGSGSGLTNLTAANITTGTLDAARIPDLGVSYVRNQTATQANSNFNISGNGTVGGTLKADALQVTNNLSFVNANRNISGVGYIYGGGSLKLAGNLDISGATDVEIDADGNVDFAKNVDITGRVGIRKGYSNVALAVRGASGDGKLLQVEKSNGDNVLEVFPTGDTTSRGLIQVNGDFVVSNGFKAFMIDHPRDPANKNLLHNAVEGPGYYTFYHGTVTLDADGAAWVELPSYFDALNGTVHYQLTCVGGYAPVYVAEEAQNNRFRIAGGRAGLKVSWQLTADRQDPYARDNPFEAEVEKKTADKNYYLYPKGYNQPEERRVGGAVQKQAAEIEATQKELKP